MRPTLLIAILLLGAATSASATMISINQTVDGRDNLYYTDWGHWYTLPSDNALYNPDSNPARDVTFGGSAYNFAGIGSIDVTATGQVVDHFDTATGPDGDPCDPTCLFNDGYFRGLPVYSLIGLWSTTADSITPIGDPHTAPFFVGSHAVLNVPTVPSAYLFLAENDGGFGDNSGHYDVNLTFEKQDVPEPSPLVLLLGGLIGLVLLRRSG